MSVEQFEQIIGLLGGVTTLGIGALIAFVLFKLIVYLSTAGAVVYCVRLLVTSVKGHLDKKQDNELDLAKNPPPVPPVPDVMIKDMMISAEAYESLIVQLQKVRTHRERKTTRSAASYGLLGSLGGSGRWLHSSDVGWIRDAFTEIMKRELEQDAEEAAMAEKTIHDARQ